MSERDPVSSSARRQWLQLAAGTLAIPLVAVAPAARAAKNDASRGALKYQDTPKDGAQCSACVQFVPGKTPKDKGGCKIIAGDTEISPTGWCVAFAKKA